MKYWIYMNGEVPGSYEPAELANIPGFSAASLVCPSGGSLQERNWQRAGLFSEIVSALEAAQTVSAPLPPAFAMSPAEPPPRGQAVGPEDILNASSQRLFRHVTELMKELENRREERALTQSLQRGLMEVKNELQAARERIRFLDGRASLIPGFEDRERRLQDLLEQTRLELRSREETLKEVQRLLEDEKLKVQEAEISRDNALRAKDAAGRDQKRLELAVDELNRQLAAKELTLAKSLGIIRRLEEELAAILPQGISR